MRLNLLLRLLLTLTVSLFFKFFHGVDHLVDQRQHVISQALGQLLAFEQLAQPHNQQLALVGMLELFFQVE